MTPPLQQLLGDRLILVSGKGGTGKTTLAAALARTLAASGRRTLLCEVDAQQPALEAIFGVRAGFTPVAVAPRLDVCNLVWPDVLAAYLKRMVRVGMLVDAILGNELVRRFLDFTPGAQDLVEISAIDDMVGRYDVVVVDMPASGHAFSLLDITRSALQLFRAGPVRQRAQELRARITDARTRVVLMALPEEMVVNETVETVGRLRTAGLLGGAPLVVLNRSHPTVIAGALRALLHQWVHAPPEDPGARALLDAGQWEEGLEVATAEAIERLRTEALTTVAVPRVATGQQASQTAEQLAVWLAGQLGLSPSEVAWT